MFVWERGNCGDMYSIGIGIRWTLSKAHPNVYSLLDSLQLLCYCHFRLSLTITISIGTYSYFYFYSYSYCDSNKHPIALIHLFPSKQLRHPKMRRQREQPIRILIQPHQQVHRALLILLSQRLAFLPTHQQPRVPIAQALIIEQLALSERVQRLFLLFFLEKLQRLQVQTLAHHDLVLLIHDSSDPAQRAAAHSLVITPPNHSHVRRQRDPAGIRQF